MLRLLLLSAAVRAVVAIADVAVVFVVVDVGANIEIDLQLVRIVAEEELRSQDRRE